MNHHYVQLDMNAEELRANAARPTSCPVPDCEYQKTMHQVRAHVHNMSDPEHEAIAKNIDQHLGQDPQKTYFDEKK